MTNGVLLGRISSLSYREIFCFSSTVSIAGSSLNHVMKSIVRNLITD